MRKINPSLQFLLPKKPFLQGHTSVNAVNGTHGNEEGGLVHPFLVCFQDILLLPRGWDADMTNSLTTTTSEETISLSFPTF